MVVTTSTSLKAHDFFCFSCFYSRGTFRSGSVEKTIDLIHQRVTNFGIQG